MMPKFQNIVDAMNGESTPQQKMFLLPRHAPVLKHLSIIRAKGAQAFINHQSEDEIIAQSILMSPGGMPGFNFLAIQLHFREI